MYIILSVSPCRAEEIFDLGVGGLRPEITLQCSISDHGSGMLIVELKVGDAGKAITGQDSPIL